MLSVRDDRFFHLRGRHVQHAHGRNSTAGGDHLTGAMIALMPTEADARRLRLSGGEKASDLHLTLFFLGDGEEWPEDDRQSVTDALISYVGDQSPGPVSGRVFGVNHWNGDGDSPCWVLSVGDLRGEDRSGRTLLEDIRGAVSDVLDGGREIPEQFTPWAPHICVAYTSDLSLTGELTKRLGDVEFDRIRVAFGGEYTDIELGDSLTAAATPPLRRNMTTLESRSRADFVRMQEDWESAVDAVMADLAPIRQAQTQELSEAVRLAADTDDLDSLTTLTLDDSALYAVLFEHMTRAANQAGEQQQAEAEAQGVSVPEWSLDNLTAAFGADLLRQVAQVTARIINSSFVQSAIRRAMSLVGRPSVSPEQAAAEVEESLSELSEAGPRESIGGAITAAQNEGRRTVLAAAPPAQEYVSSEILDRNVCGPCRSVDGTSYETLPDAQEAYPSGGYRDCLGGPRCRGTIVAVWPESEPEAETDQE